MKIDKYMLCGQNYHVLQSVEIYHCHFGHTIMHNRACWKTLPVPWQVGW